MIISVGIYIWFPAGKSILGLQKQGRNWERSESFLKKKNNKKKITTHLPQWKPINSGLWQNPAELLSLVTGSAFPWAAAAAAPVPHGHNRTRNGPSKVTALLQQTLLSAEGPSQAPAQDPKLPQLGVWKAKISRGQTWGIYQWVQVSLTFCAWAGSVKTRVKRPRQISSCWGVPLHIWERKNARGIGEQVSGEVRGRSVKP